MDFAISVTINRATFILIFFEEPQAYEKNVQKLSLKTLNKLQCIWLLSELIINKHGCQVENEPPRGVYLTATIGMSSFC